MLRFLSGTIVFLLIRIPVSGNEKCTWIYRTYPYYRKHPKSVFVSKVVIRGKAGNFLDIITTYEKIFISFQNL